MRPLKFCFFMLMSLLRGFNAQSPADLITTSTLSLCDEGLDAYLASGAPMNNYGNHPTIGGNTWTCNGNLCNSRGLFMFPISSSTKVSHAELQLFADVNWGPMPTAGGPNNSGTLRRVLSAWQEHAVTWANQPATTTLNMVAIPGSTSTAQNYTLDVTQLVIDMQKHGNFGFMLIMDDEVNFYMGLQFASSDNPQKSLCPVLTIAGMIPTPVHVNQSRPVMVAPNPAADMVTVSELQPNDRVIIMDMLGTVIVDRTCQASKLMVQEDLEQGLYQLLVFSLTGELVHTGKLVFVRQ